jgi:hypothetical protein
MRCLGCDSSFPSRVYDFEIRQLFSTYFFPPSSSIEADDSTFRYLLDDRRVSTFPRPANKPTAFSTRRKRNPFGHGTTGFPGDTTTASTYPSKNTGLAAPSFGDALSVSSDDLARSVRFMHQARCMESADLVASCVLHRARLLWRERTGPGGNQVCWPPRDSDHEDDRPRFHGSRAIHTNKTQPGDPSLPSIVSSSLSPLELPTDLSNAYRERQQSQNTSHRRSLWD